MTVNNRSTNYKYIMNDYRYLLSSLIWFTKLFHSLTMQSKKTTLKTISPTNTWNKILVITCASVLTKYERVWDIYIIMLIFTFIIHCTHYQHSDWPRVPCLFWEFMWFCRQVWLEYIYNLLSDFSIITQVIIEILALSLVENGVIFRYNHFRRGDYSGRTIFQNSRLSLCQCVWRGN